MNTTFSNARGSGLSRLAVASLLAACCTNLHAGTVIVDNDEWTLSDTGFASEGSANGTTYAQNAASFLTGGSGAVLIYSDNFGLDSGSLETALSSGGYSVTEDSSVGTPFTAASLSSYKAVFVGGDSLNSTEISALQAYVSGGGGVYIAAGTGTIPGGAVGEAAQWNSFLTPFDLTLASVYNGVGGNVPVSSTSPILSGVSQLYYNNGNDVSTLGSGPAQVIESDANGDGLIAEYSSGGSSVPDSGSTLVLAGLAIAFLGAGSRYLRQNA